jgi:23S rRNA pseudouridine1911/1915/1917 synthase
MLDGARAKPAHLLKGGESLEVALEPPRPAKPQPEPIPLSILYEDADLVVVNKPAGMVVHPGAGNPAGTLVNALLAHCTDLAGVGGELRPGIVHRLDKETSGCIVVAKNERSLAGLQAQFKRRQVSKTYLALVHGSPRPEGRIRTLHGRHPSDRKRFTGKVSRGREAITEWKVEEQLAGAALVRISLLTGRTHQIRVHFAESGHPLLGDALYGGTRREARLKPDVPARLAARELGRVALHSWKLVFMHPVSGTVISVEAPLPEDLKRAAETLGRQQSGSDL